MKLPVYTEINIDELTKIDFKDEELIKAELKKIIKKGKIGKIPNYIVTHHLSDENLKSFLKLLQSTMEKLGSSPKFPYPTYIINEKLSDHPYFFTSYSVERLPPHFFKKIKRLKAKEQLLFTKIQVVGDKVSNNPLAEKLQLLKQQANRNRELADLTFELATYEQAIEEIKNLKKEHSV